MKTSILGFLMTGLILSLGVGSSRAEHKATRDLEERSHEVNAAARKSGMRMAFERISTETGVPLGRVEDMHRRFPDLGASGVFVACVMADETGKSPERFLERRASGSTWTAIAHANRIRIEKLSARLDRLERALAVPDDGGRRRRD